MPLLTEQIYFFFLALWAHSADSKLIIILAFILRNVFL